MRHADSAPLHPGKRLPYMVLVKKMLCVSAHAQSLQSLGVGQSQTAVIKRDFKNKLKKKVKWGYVNLDVRVRQSSQRSVTK